MIDPIIFDTDCLSSFLCVKELGILNQLFKGRMAIPEQVLNEFYRRHDLYVQVESMLKRKDLELLVIEAGTKEYELFLEYTTRKTEHHLAMGKGESAVLVLAQARGGIAASNNLRDIKSLIDYLQLPYLTTADILVMACREHIINEGRGNVIWRDMLNAGCKLPQNTFSEYLGKK